MKVDLQNLAFFIATLAIWLVFVDAMGLAGWPNIILSFGVGMLAIAVFPIIERR